MKHRGTAASDPHAVLDRYDLTVLALGSIIGAGIFIVIGDTAATAEGHPGVGPGVSIAILLAAMIAFPIALCYAELSTIYPHAGTAYTYTKHAMGDFPAFMTGWSLYAPFGMIALAVGWADYVNNLFSSYDIQLKELFHASLSGSNWLAIAIAVLMIALASRELRWSRRLATVLLSVNVAIAFGFISLAFQHVNPSNWWPVLPSEYSPFQHVNLVLAATATLFYAFTGFETAAAMAQDSIAPQKDIPYAIKNALIIATLMYLLVGLGLTGMLRSDEIELGASLSKAVTLIGQPWAAQCIGIGIVSAFSCVLLTTLLRQSRLGYAMANECSDNSPNEKPAVSLAVTTYVTGIVLLAFLILRFSTREAVEIYCLSVLFGYCIVCLDLIALRIQKPTLHRPFLVPFGKLVGTTGISACLILMIQLPLKAWVWFLAWMAAGFLTFCIRVRVQAMQTLESGSPMEHSQRS